MQEERCEVCGGEVPLGSMQIKGRLRCCVQCARPPVVRDERAAENSLEPPRPEAIAGRFGIAVNGIDRLYPVEAGTLRMRVATLTSH